MSLFMSKQVRNFWKKPIQRQISLGRWGTIVSDDNKNKKNTDKSIEFNIDNANHDHCGSELCNKQVKPIKKNEYERFKFIIDDEHYPYII